MVVFHWSLNNSKSLRIFSVYLTTITMLRYDRCSFFLSSVSPVFFQAIVNRFKCTDYKWHHRYLQITHFCCSQARSMFLLIFYGFFYFHSLAHRNAKIHNMGSVFFFLKLYLVFRSGLVDQLLFQIRKNYIHLILYNGFLLVHILFGSKITF